MKTASIRELKHDMTTVLSWVEQGESVTLKKRGKTVAIINPPPKSQEKKTARPDFAARLKSIYGDKMLEVSSADLLREQRDGL